MVHHRHGRASAGHRETVTGPELCDQAVGLQAGCHRRRPSHTGHAADDRRAPEHSHEASTLEAGAPLRVWWRCAHPAPQPGVPRYERAARVDPWTAGGSGPSQYAMLCGHFV